MNRQWYEVRVREASGSGEGVKKSKFYFERGPAEAARHYRGKGTVMSVSKVSKEQALGIGDFFKLGGDLLEELRSTATEPFRLGKNNRRGSYGRKKKETTY